MGQVGLKGVLAEGIGGLQEDITHEGTPVPQQHPLLATIRVRLRIFGTGMLTAHTTALLTAQAQQQDAGQQLQHGRRMTLTSLSSLQGPSTGVTSRPHPWSGAGG